MKIPPHEEIEIRYGVLAALKDNSAESVRKQLTAAMRNALIEVAKYRVALKELNSIER